MPPRKLLTPAQKEAKERKKKEQEEAESAEAKAVADAEAVRRQKLGMANDPRKWEPQVANSFIKHQP